MELIILIGIILATQTTNSLDPTVHAWEKAGLTAMYPTSPHFDASSPTNITAQVGTHAYLPCRVKSLGNKSVSWIRSLDSHILTVDRYTFIADERFQVLHNGEAWTLQIKYLESTDAGFYECQITTEPKLSQLIHLDIVTPFTEILGEPDVFVKSGSSVQIKCVITQNLEQPSYIFWYHDSERVNEGLDEGKYSWVDRANSNTTIGTLVIKSTTGRDSGNYTCSPSNIESASVMLHILNGEHPAAMQQGSSASRLTTTSTTSSYINLALVLYTFLVSFLLIKLSLGLLVEGIDDDWIRINFIKPKTRSSKSKNINNNKFIPNNSRLCSSNLPLILFHTNELLISSKDNTNTNINISQINWEKEEER